MKQQTEANSWEQYSIYLGFLVFWLHRNSLRTKMFFLTQNLSKTKTITLYATAIRNNTNKFFHLELLSVDMSYTFCKAWFPDMVLTWPTAKEVSMYSFSKSPWNKDTDLRYTKEMIKYMHLKEFIANYSADIKLTWIE